MQMSTMRSILFFLAMLSVRRCRGLVQRAFVASVGRGNPPSLSAPPSVRLFSTMTGEDIKDEDASAVSKSRAPFSMPKHSPDDSVSSKDKKSWESLGLWPVAVDCLTKELELKIPTPVQIQAIPALLHNPKQPTCFLAATGSGKTLAYALPLLQLVKQDDIATSSTADSTSSSLPKPKRPRLIILAPTRELVLQITAVVKQLCHAFKLSSTAVYGGSKTYGRQTKALDRPIDVVVATPSRLLQHWKDQNVFLGSVQHVVLDEMDTMLEQGFATDLQALLYPVLYHKQALQKDVNPATDWDLDTSPRMVLTSATMTQSILRSIGGTKDDRVSAKRLYVKDKASSSSRSTTAPAAALLLPDMQVLKAPGLHKTVPRLQQVFIDVGASDKIDLLVDLLLSTVNKNRVMVFCNTAAACRAVQFALAQADVESLAYHGELNSAVRTDNLQAFRTATTTKIDDDDDNKSLSASSSSSSSILVCTDLAARGLDIPEVDHVILFDFPLNAADYLHRTGRTARQGRPGRVTALVAKRDQVLANAIERAVQRGDPVDGLSSRKSDYRQDAQSKTNRNSRSSSRSGRGGGGGGGGRGRRAPDASGRSSGQKARRSGGTRR